MKALLYLALMTITGCHKLTDAGIKSESSSLSLYAESDITIKEGILEVKADATSETNPFQGREREADMRAFCSFQIKKGTYLLAPGPEGVKILAKDADSTNYLNDLQLSGELKGTFKGIHRVRSQALPSNKDWKLVADNPLITVDEARTTIRIEVPCRIFK